MEDQLFQALSRVVDFLIAYQYLAIFGILLLCGLGLPIPEEVTLIAAGLLVGWGKADFVWACTACIVGILAGDSIIFGAGYVFGRRFLRSRPMRFFLSPRRQRKVSKFFARHGAKAVFFARFFAGVRIGVYAYAGSQRMSWVRFLTLDFLGALLSGTISVWVGDWAARHFAADEKEAMRKALELGREFGHWLLAGIALLVLVAIVVHRIRARRAAAAAADNVTATESRKADERSGLPAA